MNNKRTSSNKGITKETTQSVIKRNKKQEKQSKTMLEKYASGEITIWNKGLTKKTDERVARMAESFRGRKSHRKGVTWEEEYGPERANELRKRTSNSVKETMKKARKGLWICPHCGRKFTDLFEFNGHHVGTHHQSMDNPETRLKVSKALTGKKHSPEHRKNNSLSHMGKNYGKHLPERHKANIRKAKKGKHTSPSTEWKPGHSPYYPKLRFVADLGHSVRSKAEEKVCRIFVSAGINYIYEKPFKLEGNTRYYPDLTLVDTHVVVEVKGGGPVFTEYAANKYKLFRKLYPNWKFILIGTYHSERFTDSYDIFFELDELETNIHKLKETIQSNVKTIGARQSPSRGYHTLEGVEHLE